MFLCYTKTLMQGQNKCVLRMWPLDNAINHNMHDMITFLLICVNIILNNLLDIIIKNLMSGNSLYKILILGINEKVLPFLWSLKSISIEKTHHSQKYIQNLLRCNFPLLCYERRWEFGALNSIIAGEIHKMIND